MKKEKRVFLIVVAAVVASGLLFLAYSFARTAHIRELRQSTDTLSKEILLAAETLQAPETGALVGPVDSAGLAEEIYAAASRHGIRDLSFEDKGKEPAAAALPRMQKPREQEKNTRSTSHTFRIVFRSDYRSAAEFIRELQNRQAPSAIDRLSVKRGEGALDLELLLTLYGKENI